MKKFSLHKALIIFAVVIMTSTLIVSCACNGCDERKDAETFNFNQYQGKTVESILYIDEGNNFIINFTDGDVLTLHSTKYDMDVIVNGSNVNDSN